MVAALQPKDNFALKAATVQRAAPNSWKDMLDALDVMVEQAQAACVTADPSRIFAAQGRALAFMEIRDTLANAQLRVTQIDDKRKSLDRSHLARTT